MLPRSYKIDGNMSYSLPVQMNPDSTLIIWKIPTKTFVDNKSVVVSLMFVLTQGPKSYC